MHNALYDGSHTFFPKWLAERGTELSCRTKIYTYTALSQTAMRALPKLRSILDGPKVSLLLLRSSSVCSTYTPDITEYRTNRGK